MISFFLSRGIKFSKTNLYIQRGCIHILKIGDKQKLHDDIDKFVRWSEKWQMLFKFGECKCLHTAPGNTGMNYETMPAQFLCARQAVNFSFSLSLAKRVVRKPDTIFASCASISGPTLSDAA